MRRRTRPLRLRIVFAVAVPIAIVAAWQIVATARPSLYWPSPLMIVQSFGRTWLDGMIVQDVLPSLGRFVVGYLIAVVVGVVLGLLIGSFRRLRYAAEPVIDIFRAVPPPVIVPVVMLFVGIGDDMKIIVIAIGSVWPVLLNTVEGVRGIDEVQRSTADSYRVSPWRRYVRIALPAATPQILVGARQSLSIALIMMVISEMFAATNGIGFNIVQFQRLFALPEMWGGIVILGVIGVVANVLFTFAERRVAAWHFGMQESR